MKFLRRESERGEYESRPQSKRVMDSFHGSPEPTPVSTADIAVVGAPPKNPVVASTETSITMQTPDNVIGETLVVQGRVEFQNLLRIDGHFEGELIGNGSLIIGPTAEVISNLRGLNEVYVEGILIGDCVCNKMQIRFAGCVTGNLQCASLGMDPSVVLKGSANINPRDKTDKSGGGGSKTRSSTSRPRQRGQPRGSSDEASSSSRGTSVLSPESVPLRGQAFDDDKGPVPKQKSRGRGSGDLRSSGDVRDSVDGSGRSHGRGSSTSSDSSGATLHGDELPHLPPGGGGGGGGSSSGPGPGPASMPKMGEGTVNMSRTRPPVHAHKPNGSGTG